MDENGLKLLMEYDVQPDTLQDYYQFIMGQYVPALQSMGLQMSEAWHTAYGDAPNRLIGFVCGDRQTMERLLDSDLWRDLNEELIKYVSDLRYKIVPYRGGFQL
ncbi:MAG TPA: hypothetical protein PLH39_00855 [Promineifilum sp.]|nr:hypothetical protein [Promineifilum sp.]